MSLRADEVHKPVGKPSAERSTSREEGADKERKTVPYTAFSRSRAAGRLSRKVPTKRSQNSERGDARVQENRETLSSAIEAHVAACETLSTWSKVKTTVPHSGAGGLTANQLTLEAPDHTVAELSQEKTEKTSSMTADHVVVNYHTVTREYLPRTNDHEVAQYRVVALEVPDWRSHCRKLPQSGTRGTRRSQEATSEEERTEKESQPEEPVMEKKTGRGNVRLSSTARWRRTTVIWTTLPRGSNSGKQKTSADDTRREKRTTSGTTGTKAFHFQNAVPTQRFPLHRRIWDTDFASPWFPFSYNWRSQPLQPSSPSWQQRDGSLIDVFFGYDRSVVLAVINIRLPIDTSCKEWPSSRIARLTNLTERSVDICQHLSLCCISPQLPLSFDT